MYSCLCRQWSTIEAKSLPQFCPVCGRPVTPQQNEKKEKA